MPDNNTNWNKLTPEQKRQERLKSYINTEGINFAGEKEREAYLTRGRRMIDVYNVREPDRVPVNLPVGDLPYLLHGMNAFEARKNPEKAKAAIDDFNKKYSEELEYTAGPSMSMMMPFSVMEMMDYRLYSWPGHGLPEDAPSMQFIEGEYMTADEYDDLINDPSDFWIRKYLPRVFGVLKPLELFRPFTDITENMNINHFMPLATPQAQESLQKLIEVGKEFQRIGQAMMGMASGANRNAMAMIGGAFCKAPFDILGDTLRGTKGIMNDMFRYPDRLLKALDVIADVYINSILKSPNIGSRTMVSYPLHKGADGWLSQKAFDKFYWPSLKKMMDAFIDEGLIQYLFAEGSFETRLDYIDQFPKGSVVWYFDRTDMAKAKKALGRSCCLQGNIPASMLITGSPAEVKEYCKNLIGTAGKGGGFILSSGSSPHNPKLENIQAIMQAVREYGFYRK